MLVEEPAFAEEFSGEIAALRIQVAEQPAVIPSSDWIWRAWVRLGDERPQIVAGVGVPLGGTLIRSIPGRIPWSAVQRWCDWHGYGPDECDLMEICFNSLDRIYLDDWAAKNKPKH